MTDDLLSLREKEIFQTLKAISGCDFVVIGGYAVNAYTLPRFSVDCDIVVKDDNELEKIKRELFKFGYTEEESNAESQYPGNFFRYKKKIDKGFAVSIDILVNEVYDRATEVKFESEWIFKNSKEIILKGKTIIGEIKVRIIKIDALLVMKIISCRPTDIRDVFMMAPNALNKKWIKLEIAKKYNFNERVQKVIEKISSAQFKDGLSGVYGQFDQKVFEKHKKAILSLQEY